MFYFNYSCIFEYRKELTTMLNIKIMTTLLNETTKINELKLNIGLLELDLEKFMEMDLSNSETRNEMRIVLKI